MAPTSSHNPDLPIWAQTKTVWLVIAAYLLIHFATRMMMWPTLGIDDAEQALFSQQFGWSYRFRAPPSFTWVLLALNQVLDVSIFSISLIRYVLLAVIFGFTYLSASLLLNDKRLAAIATYGFSAIYVFGFYSHHDLTHTTALSAALAVSWYLCLKLLQRQTLLLYATFGLTAGLGLISKWNYLLFLMSVFIAAITVPNLRKEIVFKSGFALAILVTLLISGPTIVSTLYYGAERSDTVLHVLGTDNSNWLLQRLRSVIKLLTSLFLYAQPFLIIMLVCFWRFINPAHLKAMFNWRGNPGPTSISTLITLIAIGCYGVIALATGAANLNERLLQPALFMLPVLIFAPVDSDDNQQSPIDTKSLSQFVWILAIVAAIAYAGRWGMYVNESRSCKYCRAHLPIAELAEIISKDGFDGYGTIVTTGHHLAGNLRQVFPNARVIDTNYPLRYWSKTKKPNGKCLIVSDRISLKNPQSKLPELYNSYMAEQLSAGPLPLNRQKTVELFILGSKKQQRPFTYQILENDLGYCH